MLYLLNVVTERLRARRTRLEQTVPVTAGPPTVEFVHYAPDYAPAFYTDGRMRPILPGA